MTTDEQQKKLDDMFVAEYGDVVTGNKSIDDFLVEWGYKDQHELNKYLDKRPELLEGLASDDELPSGMFAMEAMEAEEPKMEELDEEPTEEVEEEVTEEETTATAQGLKGNRGPDGSLVTVTDPVTEMQNALSALETNELEDMLNEEGLSDEHRKMIEDEINFRKEDNTLEVTL